MRGAPAARGENPVNVFYPQAAATSDFPRLSGNEKNLMGLLRAKPRGVGKEAEKILSVYRALAARVLKGLVDKRFPYAAGGGRRTRREPAGG
jgi:hypothetical protein